MRGVRCLPSFSSGGGPSAGPPFGGAAGCGAVVGLPVNGSTKITTSEERPPFAGIGAPAAACPAGNGTEPEAFARGGLFSLALPAREGKVDEPEAFARGGLFSLALPAREVLLRGRPGASPLLPRAMT